MPVTPRGYVGWQNGDNAADVTNMDTLLKINADMQAALSGATTPAAINMAGAGNYAMSAAQGEAEIIFLGGARTANGNLNLPRTAKAYIIYNGCTGNYQIFANTTGAAAFAMLPQGATSWVWCDGTSVYLMSCDQDRAVAVPAANYLVKTGDHAVYSDDSGGNLNHTLPAPGATWGSPATPYLTGYEFELKKLGSAAHTTIWTPAAGTIEGASSLVMTTQNQFARLRSDGSSVYRIVG